MTLAQEKQAKKVKVIGLVLGAALGFVGALIWIKKKLK